MKTTVRFGCFDGEVKIRHGDAIISHERDDFGVFMEEISRPGVKSMRVSPLDFRIELEDGWILHLRMSPEYRKDYLIVTRFKEQLHKIIEEYLTTNGRWLPIPEGYSPYPDNIMKIPISAPKESKEA